jgi:2-C-methyl-D-erythritol 2,4-cyclodiphosphate synthase
MDIRVGHGFDVHKLVPGRKLWLGGIEIPFIMGLSGHSDADVLIHAICDALLGAMAKGDIGNHFPDSDDEYRDIDSKILLKKVYKILEADGWELGNLDATLIMEEPQVSGFVPKMRKKLASILNTGVENISIKATTSESLGPEGRGEGISAHAVALIRKA